MNNRVWRIKVDPEAKVDDEGEFWIKVDGIGMLDPRVKIIESEVFNLIINKTIDDFVIDDLGMTGGEAAVF